MKTIYESDKLKITKNDNYFELIIKFSDYWLALFFDGYFNDAHGVELNGWDIVKQYPTIMPILVDLGELEKWENGFKTNNTHTTYYYDMQMIYRIEERSDGSTYYYKYGKLHRLDGPAVIWKETGGDVKWFINGEEITGVDNWLAENNYTIPFNKSVQAQFILKFAR